MIINLIQNYQMIIGQNWTKMSLTNFIPKGDYVYYEFRKTARQRRTRSCN